MINKVADVEFQQQQIKSSGGFSVLKCQLQAPYGNYKNRSSQEWQLQIQFFPSMANTNVVIPNVCPLL